MSLRGAVTFLADYQRDPARAVRKQLEEMWAQMDSEAAQASKSATEQAYAKSYAQRREPNDAA